MSILFDWILIFLSTLISFNSYKRIVFVKNCSVSNYVIIILYVFCVVPIILNYLIGVPTYNTIYWYKVFLNSIDNEQVNIIYDFYVLLCIFSLYFTFGISKTTIELKRSNSLTSLIQNNKFFSVILITLPVLLILISGDWKSFLIYGTSSIRGLSERIDMAYITSTLLVSMLCFFTTFFNRKKTFFSIFYCIIYFIIIVWISGKRFMVANILLLLIFYVTNSNISIDQRKKWYKLIPIFCIFLIFFSGLYLMYVKPLSSVNSNSIYDMLRVDFGRDDVIKYVINEEVIKDNRILEYRGETFISLFLSFVPRKIWHSKPYPHYRYLTASILKTDIYHLPAGTTPSLLEMTICNFGLFGFPFCVVFLLLLCKLVDNCKDVDTKAIGVIISSVLLTQSMDAYLVVVLFLIMIMFFSIIFKNKSIKIVWRR